jgi:hypothetical protein
MNKNRLTHYYRRKKRAILEFLKTAVDSPAGGDLQVVRDWITAIVPNVPPDGKSLEERLEAALKAVEDARIDAKLVGSGHTRRSERLYGLVVGAAVSATPEGDREGFGLSVADTFIPPGAAGPAQLADYQAAVIKAAAVASEFLEAAKNNNNVTGLKDSLDALILANPTMNPDVLEELTGLVGAMKEYKDRGGVGGESAYWPSSWVSSSSSSS